MNNTAKSKGNEKNRLPYRRIYTAFYCSDWPWHLLLLVVLGGTMALFTGLAIMVRQLADLAFAGAPFAELLREGIFVALALVGIAVLGGVQRTLLRYVLRTRLLNRLQPALVERALTFPLDHFTKRSPGDLLAVISNIASSAADGVTMMVEPLFTLLQALFLVMVMAFISLPLTAGVLGLLLLYYGVVQWFRRRQGQLFGQVIESRRVLTGIAGDAHRGFNEIKQNALEETFSRHFSTASRIHWRDFSAWFKNLLVATATADFVNTLLPGVVLFIAALPALAGGMDGAMLVTLYTLAVMLGRLLQALTEVGASSASGLRAWADVIEMMDEPSERSGGKHLQGYDLEWKDVSRRMRDTLVLDRVSLTIREGEKVMICGRSGEGKSTALKMLPGLLEADSGEVRAGGVPANEADPTDLRSLVGFVPQDPYLFETTLRENLTYGRTITEAKLERVIQLVQLEEFVRTLPDGLDTRLGPDGATVSGGEKARIALARAILRQPDILILDEATSSLDSETEERIYQYLLERPSTVVGVTHRLSTLKLFPRIVALADSRVVLDGPTEEVVASPIFQEMFAYQMEPEAAS
ncbi:ABC transporter ATP-binding protein/permease [Dehalococcoidia bacterium]|nr:ABC transporter ATP-binding protein/permease [Dehalococcoidia bacterium]